jgi:hypothetical protein
VTDRRQAVCVIQPIICWRCRWTDYQQTITSVQRSTVASDNARSVEPIVKVNARVQAVIYSPVQINNYNTSWLSLFTSSSLPGFKLPCPVIISDVLNTRQIRVPSLARSFNLFSLTSDSIQMLISRETEIKSVHRNIFCPAQLFSVDRRGREVIVAVHRITALTFVGTLL